MHRVVSISVRLVAVAGSALAAAVSLAQQVERSTSIVSSDVASQVSAFNYREGPESELLFTGTALAPKGYGDAEVEFQDGRSTVKAKVKKLPRAKDLGPYTVYVLWAVAPDGRATNIGVIDAPDGKGKLRTSYSGSEFALIVTAEPHFAVSVPSTAVVLFNLAKKVKGVETKVTSLAERADYRTLRRIPIDGKTAPADLVGARYALSIAAVSGAEQYAPSEFAAAQSKLEEAEKAQASDKRSERNSASLVARDATQSAEVARRAALRGKAEADAKASRAAAAAAAAEEAAAAERVRAQERAAETARVDLLNRLDRVLPTRETQRGLVSEFGGVQFASGTSKLTQTARETLARFAGVVASYPTLQYDIEGHTDSVGRENSNRDLSLQRSIAVRDFLIGQGIRASAIDVAGFGSSMPVADNATADGRARNRRVEIVVSGGPLAK
jgi:outer membrane protein OmpA-like peptidoglycan-associated protein